MKLESIDNLRKLASDFRSDVYKRDESDYIDKLADEIQAEINKMVDERNALIRDLYDNLWTHKPKCAEAFMERIQELGIQ